jgi:hypothetical protein
VWRYRISSSSSRFSRLSCQHREFWTQEKAESQSEDVARELHANDCALISDAPAHPAKDHQCTSHSDFYRLRQGLHDNSSNAACAKCAAAAHIASIALTEHAITG